MVSSDGDFGEILGYVCGFSVLDAEGIGVIIFGVSGDTGGGFCTFGCVGLIGLVIVR